MKALMRAMKVLQKHPLGYDVPASKSEDRSRSLLDAVAAIVAAGDDPEQVLRDALTRHVTNKNKTNS